MPLKSACGSIALLPLYAPSLVQALGILFLFGRNGLINRTFDLRHRHLRLLGHRHLPTCSTASRMRS